MLKWTEDYKIEVDIIDDEHKQIIDEFEQLYEIMKLGEGHQLYSQIVDFLENYVEKHFDHEESYQKEIQYPFIDEHIEFHKKFRARISQLKLNFKGNKASNKELIELNLIIKDWLINHILSEDKKIADYIKLQNEIFGGG